MSGVFSMPQPSGSWVLDDDLPDPPPFLAFCHAWNAAVRAALAAAKVGADGKKDLVCLIAGDKDARHGDVTHVIDLVKQEGVVKFAINVDPISTTTP